MERAQVKIVYHGPAAEHNMPCAIKGTSQPAVLCCNRGVFEPSWKAQREGWHLIQAKTRLQKLIFKWFFEYNG